MRLLAIITAVSGTALVGSWSFAQGGGEPKMHIEVETNSLSVELRNVAMSDVLWSIGEQAGVKVSICGKLDNIKEHAFKGKPLGDGTRELAETSDVDIIMIHEPGRRLMEVHAYKWPPWPTPTPPPLRVHIPGAQSLPAKHK